MARLRILAVDISGLFRTHWEINQGKGDTLAVEAATAAVARARDGFDRVAICCDSGPSFRRAIWPEYKANRTDPGAAYREQLRRAVEQLEADGCTIFRAPQLLDYQDETGAALSAEADDVIGSLVSWAVESGHTVRIYSADKDLLQLVGQHVDQVTFKGTVMDPLAVAEKLGVLPREIPDYLALCGDSSDNFKPFDGIGPKGAVALLKRYQTALGVFVPENLATVHEIVNKTIAEALRAEGARERAERCLQVATIKRDLDIDFSPLLAGPVFRRVEAASKVAFPPRAPQLAAVPQPVEPEEAKPHAVHAPAEHAMAVRSPERIAAPAALIKRPEAAVSRLDPYALEPQTPQEAWALAQTLHASQMYRQQFMNPESILAVLLRGRSLGIPTIVALESAYMVHGRVGWSARMLRSLAMGSPDCEYFRIAVTEMHRAVALCKRRGEPELVIESTTEMARERGLVVKGGKWEKDPLSMNVADVERRGARLVWPERVTGLFTPDELELGLTADGESIREAA
jgi:5'-3' exonuclease